MVEHRDEPWRDPLWEQLCGLRAEEVTARTGARTDGQNGYRIAFLNTDYRVDPAGRWIGPVSGREEAADSDLRLVLLYFLCRGQRIPPSGRRVSEKELPSGATFFRGPHALPTDSLARRFGQDRQGFLDNGRALGGRPAGLGDASLELTTLPDLPVTCVLWVEDEEFPARAGFLFDPVIGFQLPPDMVLALTQVLTRLLLDAPP